MDPESLGKVSPAIRRLFITPLQEIRLQHRRSGWLRRRRGRERLLKETANPPER
jgi:hypothetical protein